MSPKQRRLIGLRGKLTRQKNDAEALRKRGIFIDTRAIQETEWEIAMLEQDLTVAAAK